MAHRPAIVSTIQSDEAVVSEAVVDGDSDDDSAVSPDARTMMMDPRRPAVVRRALRGARADADAKTRVVVVVVDAIVVDAIARVEEWCTREWI